MGIVGRIWLDGQRVSGEVLAFINGQQCGRGKAEGTPPKPLLLLPISSDAHQPGCGVPGATITFTINGRAANETVAWKPGITQQMVTLSAGPRIAIYQGTLRIDRGRPPPMRVVPYIGGVVCGAAVAPWFLITDDARWSYEVVVDPDGLRLGCDAPPSGRRSTRHRPRHRTVGGTSSHADPHGRSHGPYPDRARR